MAGCVCFTLYAYAHNERERKLLVVGILHGIPRVRGIGSWFTVCVSCYTPKVRRISTCESTG